MATESLPIPQKKEVAPQTKTYKNIYAALFAFQQSAPVIKRTAENPFHKSKYADLPEIWQTIKPLLNDYQLFIQHQTKDGSGAFDTMETVVHYLPTGEKIISTCTLPLQKATAQEYGSCLTYMRRYQLCAVLGLITDEDDDGNAASGNNKQPPSRQQSRTQPNSPPAPAPKPITEAEITDLQTCLREAKDVHELKNCWDKVDAAKKRMTQDQRSQLALLKNKRKDELTA